MHGSTHTGVVGVDYGPTKMLGDRRDATSARVKASNLTTKCAAAGLDDLRFVVEKVRDVENVEVKKEKDWKRKNGNGDCCLEQKQQRQAKQTDSNSNNNERRHKTNDEDDDTTAIVTYHPVCSRLLLPAQAYAGNSTTHTHTHTHTHLCHQQPTYHPEWRGSRVVSPRKNCNNS